MTPRKAPIRKKSVHITKKSAHTKMRIRPRAATKALSVSDPVKRGSVSASSLADSQMALFRAMMAVSPIRMLLSHQAAFWHALATDHDASRRRV